jgi:hypothetical protein
LSTSGRAAALRKRSKKGHIAETVAPKKATLCRVNRRRLPLLMLACLFRHRARTQAGLAALQMNKDVALSGTVLGPGVACDTAVSAGAAEADATQAYRLAMLPVVALAALGTRC